MADAARENECMIANEPESVRSRACGEIGFRFRRQPGSRSGGRGLEQRTVPKTEGTAALTHRLGVDGQHDGSREPAGLAHLANSGMAFRYCFVP